MSSPPVFEARSSPLPASAGTPGSRNRTEKATNASSRIVPASGSEPAGRPAPPLRPRALPSPGPGLGCVPRSARAPHLAPQRRHHEPRRRVSRRCEREGVDIHPVRAPAVDHARPAEPPREGAARLRPPPSLAPRVDLGVEIHERHPTPVGRGHAVPVGVDPQPGREQVDQVVDRGAEVGLLLGLLRPAQQRLAVRLVLRERARVEDAEPAGAELHGLGGGRAGAGGLPVDLLDVLDDHDRGALRPAPRELRADLAGQVPARHVRLAEQDERPAPGLRQEPLDDRRGGVPVALADHPEPPARRRIGGDDRRSRRPRGRDQATVPVPGIAPVALVPDPAPEFLLADPARHAVVEELLVAGEDHLEEERQGAGARQRRQQAGGEILAGREGVVVADEDDVGSLAGANHGRGRQAPAMGAELAMEVLDVPVGGRAGRRRRGWP